MDREKTIAAIRKESLNLPTSKLMTVLDRFQLGSYSERCLNDVCSSRLEEMLGMIRRFVILGDE